MSSRQWSRLAETLASTHRVVAPDLLGSGANPAWPDDEPFDLRQDVEAIESVVDELGGEAHVVGHSYGGLLALTLARRAPERVRSLAVYDPVAFGVLYAPDDAEGLADLARAASTPVFTDYERGGSDAWFEAFIDYWNGPGAWRGMTEAGRASFLRVGRKVFYEVWSLMHDRTPGSAYASIEAPALLLGGAASPAAARRVVDVLAHALPNARLQMIPGAGHMGPLSHGSIVNGAIAAHIRAADYGSALTGDNPA
jgi:pimeloyl-ACP methyl ester carboxylesterase